MKHIIFLGSYSDKKRIFKTKTLALAFIASLRWPEVLIGRDKTNNLTIYKQS